MRDNLLIAGLLACGVTALPQAAQAPTEEMLQLLEEALPPIPNVPPKVPENPLPVLPENDTGTADVDVCQLPFETAEEGQSSWDSSGAEEFLSQYITSHGVDGWANHILKDTVSGGLQGQTFDCENIQEISSCSLPMDRSCETYDPPEAYFVHISIANLNSLLHTLYLTLIDEELDDFVSKAEEIEDAFGSPEEEGLFAILIGSFVMGAAAAGPMWVAGAPMTAFVGILNVAAGAAANGGDVTEDLETTIKVTYTRFRDYIEATSKAIMSGDFTALGGHVDDYLAFITDSFSAGQMMVVDKKNLAADTYLASFGKWLDHILIIKCLDSNGWKLQIFDDISHEECDDFTEGTGSVMITPMNGAQCVAIASMDEGMNPNNPNDNKHWVYLDDKLDQLAEYGLDLEAAMKNILNCNGGDFDYSDPRTVPVDGSYPPCMLSMTITDKIETS